MLRKIKFTLQSLAFQIGKRLADTRLVFELRDPNKLDRREIPGEETHFFAQAQEIPAPLRQEIHRALGPQGLRDIEAFFKEGGQLCVLTCDGVFGALSWVRRGDLIPRWGVPLTAHDYVLSRGWADKAFRGRGMYGRCITATHDRVATGEGRLLADCHTRNAASARQFKRTGFDVIAQVRM